MNVASSNEEINDLSGPSPVMHDHFPRQRLEESRRRNHEGKFQPDKGRPPIIAIRKREDTTQTNHALWPLLFSLPYFLLFLSPSNLNLIAFQKRGRNKKRNNRLMKNSYGYCHHYCQGLIKLALIRDSACREREDTFKWKMEI